MRDERSPFLPAFNWWLEGSYLKYRLYYSRVVPGFAGIPVQILMNRTKTFPTSP
jgi:hypothetical protein